MIELSPAHHEAVNRRRRIVVQYDPNLEIDSDLRSSPTGGTETVRDAVGTVMVGHSELGGQSVFAYEDDPDTQIDGIYWDMGGPSTMATWRSRVLEPFNHPALVAWWTRGRDLVKALLDATHERGLEAFWNFRVSEADFQFGGGDVDELPAIKKQHPDWIIRDIHWSGDWNYAVPEVRQFNLEVLREVAHDYDFDGMQLDFTRHAPILPPGEEWEHRDGLTRFVAAVREMTLDVERQRGRPFLLAVKIPQNIDGCRADGIDVQTWARNDLVDILTLGCRSMDVDIAAFRNIVADRNIKLQPCMETHHATAGYKWQPIEFFRGVYGNWWRQGADSVMTFNWSAALQQQRDGEFAHRYEATRVELQAYKEIGEARTLAGKDKFFAVERRGGFPWSGGFTCRNDTAPLPVTLTNFGRPANLAIRISDEPADPVTLRVVLFGAREGDHIETIFNGASLTPALSDHDWKDRQIHSPRPQPNTCGLRPPPIDPDQRLLRLDYRLDCGTCRIGENEISIRIRDRIQYQTGEDIVVEKVEVYLGYAPPSIAQP
jgi:hypothetical protein